MIAFSLDFSHPLSKVIRTFELKKTARNIYRSVLGNYGPAAQPIRMRIGALWTGKLTQPYNKQRYCTVQNRFLTVIFSFGFLTIIVNDPEAFQYVQ